VSDWRREQAEFVDVLIVTALKEEYEAVLQVEEGALPGSTWVTRTGPVGLDVALRTFQAADGSALRIAVTRPLTSGGEATAQAASPLVLAYKPRCVAMCGVCAGRRGHVEQGDVIIASRVWTYDTGKREVGLDASGRSVEQLHGDALSYNIPVTWRQKAEAFMPQPGIHWLSQRPRPYAAQMDWMLERILKGEDPAQHFERKTKCGDYTKVLGLLWKRGWLQDKSLNLTDEGRKHIEGQRLLYPDGLPEPRPFRVHVGPIGTGRNVVRDPRIFEHLSVRESTLIGLEMEASAIGAMAYLHEVPFMVVMKGVMDFADQEKDDQFKPFAARASAECLIAFIRAHLPPHVPSGRHPGSALVSLSDFQDVIERGTLPQPADPSPSALLDARYGFVPFFELGRSALLQDLREWCDGDQPVSARLFHGAGGIGKTRLFFEWTERLARDGWWTGFLVKAVDADRFEELLSVGNRLLIVIDYAESRQSLGALLQFVARRRHGGHDGRLRVVLLARTRGDWWQELLASDGALKDLLGDRPPTGIGPLVPAGQERKKVFEDAAQRFAGVRGHSWSQVPHPELNDSRFDRVLYVHMAALASVEGLSFTADSLMEELLDHEERFWLTHAHPTSETAAAQRLFKERVRQAVAALTLQGGSASKAKAEAMLSRLDGSHVQELLLFLRDLYPGGKERAGSMYLSGLEPDLLGEAMVLRTLRKQDDPAGGWLDRVFADADYRAIRNGLEVLGRISADYPDEVGNWIAWMLEQDLKGRAVMALEAAKAVGLRTAHAGIGRQLATALERNGTVEIATRLQRAGIPEHTVGLRGVGLWATETLLRHFPDTGAYDVLTRRAALLNDLANRQSDLGQWQEALASANQAVAIRRKLAEMSPGTSLSDLAGSLNNLSVMQREFGQLQEALASAYESVVHYRNLAEGDPETFLPYLALGLNNLSISQGELGQRQEALASTQEAAGHYRKLVEMHPDAFLPSLAMSLNNLGNDQQKLGQWKAALGSIREAVEHYSTLADANPDAFLPNLAKSLNNLGIIQNALGQEKEALVSIQAAVGIDRKLAEADPLAFLPELAGSLNSLGDVYGTLGQRHEALAFIQEAVVIRRKLAEERPEVYMTALADSLNLLARRQSELEHRQEALASMQETVAIRRKLAEANSTVFLPRLAGNLNDLGLIYGGLGKKEAAIDSIQESLDIIWPLFLSMPLAFSMQTELVLRNLRSFLDASGQPYSNELKARIRIFMSWLQRR